MRLTNRRTRETILQDIIIAKHVLSRLKGLLFVKKPKKGLGLYLTPCKAVHTLGMRYAIDVIFLDAQNQVLKLIPSLKPNRVSPFIWKAHAVLETAGGFLDETDIQPCDQLEFQ